jgi:polyisoprenoid-binding protein YceI
MKTPLYLFLFLFFCASVQAQFIPLTGIPDQSSATYKLVHPLHEIEATSKEVEYHATIDPANRTIERVTATVDVTTFDSGNSNRDSHAMEVVDALTYPDVTFTATKIISNGQITTVKGQLTFHGVTDDIVATVTPVWSDSAVSFTGGFNISLTQFKIDRPSLLMILVSDTLHFTLKTAFRWK